MVLLSFRSTVFSKLQNGQEKSIRTHPTHQLALLLQGSAIAFLKPLLGVLFTNNRIKQASKLGRSARKKVIVNSKQEKKETYLEVRDQSTTL